MASLAATQLPPIKVGGQVTQQVIRHVPSPPAKGSSMGSPFQRSGRGAPRTEGSLKKSPPSDLKRSTSADKIDTSRYRNTYEHNLCLDMLKEGFHQSFRELFNLMEKQKEEIASLGPDSGLSDQPLLEDEPEKLDQLKYHLTTAEAAKRRGKMDQVYHSLLALARFFEETGDSWLSDHFFDACLKTSLKIRGDGRRKESEANCNMGLASEKRGDLLKAAEHLESFYNLTKGRLWQTDNGENLHSLSCGHLRRVYTTMSEKIKEEDRMKSIDYLLKAYGVAKESGDIQQEGLAGYRLGNAYEEIGDPETAILYHNGYLEKCQEGSDNVGMGWACQALARAYEVQGDVESAMKYLEMFVELADKSEQLPEQQKACTCLGAIYNSLGKYEDAIRMYRRGFEIAQDLAALETTETTRVEYGIALAHTLLTGYSQCMDQVSKNNTQRLLDFKSSRWDTFSEEERVEVGCEEVCQPNSDVGSAENEGSLQSEEVKETDGGEEKDGSANGGTDSGVTSEGENGTVGHGEIEPS
ncbi:Tetratricopeptide repeat protein 29, partial [Acropora cervicornis]